jgi:hypothetical protein
VGFDGRALVPGAKIEFGDFMSGGSTTVELKNVWRATPHLMMEGFYQITALRLPEGDFNAHVWRSRVSVPIQPRMTADAYVQWNSVDDVISTQLRFQLIYARDSNLFVVYTDGRRALDAPLLTRSHGHDQSVQVKLTYRLYQ